MFTTTLLAPTWAAAASNLYRFVNAEGQVEISHAIPTDRVALGYEVLDAKSGRVVQVIDAQKTQAEVDRINRETLARNACETALARVNSLYQSEQDIADARKHAVESLGGRIANATHNLDQLREQQRSFQAAAAHGERSGSSLDAGLVDNIQRTDTQIGNLEREIEQRHREQSEAGERFARDLALFQQASCVNEADLGFVKADLANNLDRNE